jgi:HAMP domain-containing protein
VNAYRESAKPSSAREKAKHNIEKIRLIGDINGRRPVSGKDFMEIVAVFLEGLLNQRDEIDELKNRIEVLETWRVAQGVEEKP